MVWSYKSWGRLLIVELEDTGHIDAIVMVTYGVDFTVFIEAVCSRIVKGPFCFLKGTTSFYVQIQNTSDTQSRRLRTLSLGVIRGSLGGDLGIE
jgi:hypothetical protein